jgi:hypothetical protein
VEAAMAYDQAAREHHKQKAKLNFPEGPPRQLQGASSEVQPQQVRAGGLQQGRLLSLATGPPHNSLRVACDV